MTRSTTASSRGGWVAGGSAALLVVALGVSEAFAQAPSPTDARRADTLFRDARKLMSEGRFAEACPKFAESQRLDPAGGTLLNLGICHAGEGKVKTAWTELKQALEAARKDGRTDREKIAADELAKIEPRLSRLSVQVPPSAKVPGLEVKIDGTRLSPSAWGTPSVMEPGAYRIEATAPARRSFTMTVEIKAEEGDSKAVDIPILAEIKPVQKPQPKPEPGGGAQRTAAYVVGGSGIVAISVGGIFGIHAMVKDQEADTLCPLPACSDRKGLDASRAANTSATVANVGIGVGLAAVGVGVVLLLTAGSAKKKPGAAIVIPLVSPGGGAAVFSGVW